MKKIARMMLVTLSMSLLAGAGTPALADVKTDPKVTLRLSSASPAQMDDSKALVEVAKFLNTESGGTIVLRPFFSSALFDEVAGMGAAQKGLVDMAIACTCNMTRLTNAFLFADLPYIFKNMDSGSGVWTSPVGVKAREQLQNSTGLVAMAFAPSGGGQRMLWSNRGPVKTPADLRGLKIRTTATPIEQEFWKLGGAIPTPVDIGETYSALQQGVVDGQHLQPMWAQMLKHDEVTKFGTEIGAATVYRVLVINSKSLAKMTPAQQEVFKRGMKLFEERAAHYNREGRDASLKAIRDKKVTIYTPTAAEMAQWQELGKRFRDSEFVTRQVPADVIKQALAAQQ